MSPADRRLERRYARVLRLYPTAYREERGPELLATLLDAADDKRHQLPGLLLGALRAHAGQDRRTLRDTWLTASRIAVLALLVSSVLTAPLRFSLYFAYGAPVDQWLIDQSVPDLVATPFGLTALVLTLRGRYLGAAVAAVVAVVVATPLWMMNNNGEGAFLRYVFAALLLLPLVRHAPRPAAGLLRYVPLLPAVVMGVDQFSSYLLPSVVGRVSFAVTVAIGVGAIVWAAVDERVTLAVGLTFLTDALVWTVGLSVFVFQAGGIMGSMAALGLSVAFTAGVPALLLGVAAVAARRQVRL
ncbi:hypothetical protein [Cryptosporangium sp. NPDC048952]|uniref:hypothetical protein n=1 Tax=Cryptosporangium sp. NPDC048952 TaxID=3363961 RepID=UPI00371DF3FA